MMKASELRIGNLLEFWNGIEPRRTVQVGRRFFSSACVEKDDDFEITGYYKGIRITKDILVKLGFDVEMIKGTTSDNVLLKGKEYFLFSDNGLKFYFQTYNGTSNRVYIEYVHQLQNLFFALTGKELTVSSPPSF